MSYLFLFLLFLAHYKGHTTSHFMNDSSFIFTEKDNQREVQVSLEDTLVIALEARPGTGYIWTVPTAPSLLQLIKEESKQTEPHQTEPLPGGKELQYFYFRPLQAGIAEITLHYQRPWEKEIVRTFTLYINVSS